MNYDNNEKGLPIDIGYNLELKKYYISSFIYSYLIDEIDYDKLMKNEYILFNLDEIKELIKNFRMKHPGVSFKVYLSDNDGLSDVNNDYIAMFFGDDINFYQDVQAVPVFRR